MKPSLRIFLAITAALLFAAMFGAATAAAQTASPPQERAAPRLITVTGEAEILVIPDEVVLTLGVETANRQLNLAKRQNDEIVAQVLAAAQARGIAAKFLQTEQISIEPRYRDSYEQRDFIGYFVRKTIVITLKDVSAFDDVLTSVLDAGAGYVHGIQFRTTELRKHKDAARALAIQAAREKASALAKELGQEVGQPHEIREDQSGWWSAYNAWWGGRASALTQNVIQESNGAAQGTEGTLAPGQISVTARVTVSFELK
jgi:uncharacterized protein YggE